MSKLFITLYRIITGQLSADYSCLKYLLFLFWAPLFTCVPCGDKIRNYRSPSPNHRKWFIFPVMVNQSIIPHSAI